eukprot:g1290.t1
MAGAAAAAAAALKRIQEKRERALKMATMTKEEKEKQAKEMKERERIRAQRLKEEQKKHAYELAAFRGHGKCIHMHVLIRESTYFQAFIIGVICIAGLLVGFSLYDVRSRQALLAALVMENLVVLIFCWEMEVKLVAEGRRPWLYFTDAWNVFDFFIVFAGFIPLGGGGAIMVLRLLRLLRVLKLVRALPKLRILVIGLIMSMSSIAYIGLLLLLLFYLFAVLLVSVYGENDPVHLGQLHIAIISLFRAATLEDWTDLMYTSMFGCKKWAYDGMEQLCTHNSEGGAIAAIIWVIFITLASLMILNLFIGVITGSMEDAKAELEAELDGNAKDDLQEDESESADDDASTQGAAEKTRAETFQAEEKEGKKELVSRLEAMAHIFGSIADDIHKLKVIEDDREIRNGRSPQKESVHEEIEKAIARSPLTQKSLPK